MPPTTINRRGVIRRTMYRLGTKKSSAPPLFFSIEFLSIFSNWIAREKFPKPLNALLRQPFSCPIPLNALLRHTIYGNISVDSRARILGNRWKLYFLGKNFPKRYSPFWYFGKFSFFPPRFKFEKNFCATSFFTM